MAAIQQNQLLFNLDMPAMPVNIASRFHRPEAIVIEKFGSSLSSGPIITAPKPAFQFSAVSEESLSNAVQLARRDLKKQKEESILASQQKKPKATGKNAAKTGRTQVVHSEEYRERLKRREDRKKQEKTHTILMKEREKGWKVRTAKTQTRNDVQAQNRRIPSHRMIPDMPAMSMSPPTRDIGPDPTQLSGDSRTLAEIRKLREDMDSCLNKIHQIHDMAKKNPSAWKRDDLVYDEDIQAEKKRVMRSDEQATRSARTIYQLNQQVRFIQDEINCIGPTNIKHNKKSDILSRVAAVHRGAVRALQNFIQHLPDCDLSQGLPRSYHELALLLRQLSLCCAQLEVAGEMTVPDNVLTLLKDYADMNKVLDQHSSPKSPPRHCQMTKQVRDHTKKSPVSRKLEYDAGAGQRRTSKKPEVRVEADHRGPRESPLTIDRVGKHTVDRVEATPDRQAALRAGIAALVRAADSPPMSPRSERRHQSPVPPLDLPVTPRTPRGVAWEYPLEKPKLQQFKTGHKKGLLLPAKLKEKRRKIQKTRPAPQVETHYAGATVSSRLKEVPPEERLPIHPRSPRIAERHTNAQRRPRSSSLPGTPQSAGRPRSPSPYGTPRYSGRPRSPSPYGTPRDSGRPGTPRVSGRPRSPSPFGTPRSPGGRDIIRQVQMDREKGLIKNERAKIDRLRRELGQPEEWVARAEEKIREKLQPLLDQAQVEVNADLLADSLLGELLEDTAREVGHVDGEPQVEYQAAAMQDAPSMETMLQRLQDMENEQQDIRRRWATLVYEEENIDIPARARYFDAPLSEQPSTPTPIHVMSRLPDIHQTLLPDGVLARLESNPADQGAILFTKPVAKSPLQSSLHLSQLDGALHIRPKKVQTKPGIPIVISQEVLQSIDSHKKEFEQYLKKNSYQSVGRFNPWAIVEEVAGEILDECLRDVSKELEDINTDIVNQVYSREFGAVPSPDSSNKPTTVPSYGGDVPSTSYPSYTKHPVTTHQSESTNQKIVVVDATNEEMHSRGNSPNEAVARNDQFPSSTVVEATNEEMYSRGNSPDEAVPRSAQSPSPDPVSGNYSYDDDFAESSQQGKTADDVSNRSDYSQDSWKSD